MSPSRQEGASEKMEQPVQLGEKRDLKVTSEREIFIADLFMARTDVFAIQQPNGFYYPERRTLTQDDLQRHLSGKVTIGGYQVCPENTSKCLCFDVDIKKEILAGEGLSDRLKADSKNICKLLIGTCRTLDLNAIIEYSGRKGFHVWIPFVGRIPASEALELGDLILEKCDFKEQRGKFRVEAYPNIEVERFPKQGRIQKNGLGNLIKTPLGKHQTTGVFSCFLDENFKKVENPHQLFERIYKCQPCH